MIISSSRASESVTRSPAAADSTRTRPAAARRHSFTGVPGADLLGPGRAQCRSAPARRAARRLLDSDRDRDRRRSRWVARAPPLGRSVALTPAVALTLTTLTANIDSTASVCPGKPPGGWQFRCPAAGVATRATAPAAWQGPGPDRVCGQCLGQKEWSAWGGDARVRVSVMVLAVVTPSGQWRVLELTRGPVSQR